MTNKEILEGNRLIADFIKMTVDDDGIVYVDDKFFDELEDNYYEESDFPYNEYLFHKSWNWLMPVVEKIESLEFGEHEYFTVNIVGGNNSYIESSTGELITEIMGRDRSKIFTVWTAVIEFIKWYNDNN